MVDSGEGGERKNEKGKWNKGKMKCKNLYFCIVS